MSIIEKRPMSWFKREAKKNSGNYTEEDMIEFAKGFLRGCQRSKVTPYQLEIFNKGKKNG